LASEDELFARVESPVAERDRLVAGITAAGWWVPEPQGNFVWFDLGERTAEPAAAAGEAGIAVRPFAGEGVRVSVGEPEATDRLVELLGRLA
ncbi:aminotransferase class I/II-fold pyridoxal phosphate-dependent enzyme, partial [Nocardioides antri]|uniref:aminotransferase class I/II-fold pyridoxal phosphate-dependent enzyme n=1 Tax=Nocardioides antri TaxID=2607659 RepID=UPI0034CF8FA9